MNSPVDFAKMHGLGNDYVYVDGSQFPVDDAPALARWVSDRHFGVGSDGLIMVEPVSPGVDADVRMRMFNADGSEGMMCGNGIRCVAKFAVDRGISDRNPLRVETRRGVLEVAWRRGGHDGTVHEATVDMGPPILACARIPASIPGVSPAAAVIDHALDANFWRASGAPAGWEADAGLEPALTLVSMGNPHAVQRVDDVDTAPVLTQGPLIEHHPAFPRRVNAGFMQIVSRSLIRLRVYERGAGETLACGTGACAAVVAGIRQGWLDHKVDVQTHGGLLTIEWAGQPDSPVRMTGPATPVFEGTIDIPDDL